MYYIHIYIAKIYKIKKSKNIDKQWELYHKGYVGITYLALIYIIIKSIFKK